MNIRNTAVEAQRQHALLMLGILGNNPSRAIEAQEADGQRELCASAQLPTDGIDGAIALGIEVIGPSKGDPLFHDVRLPEGWQIKPTDHSMWSELVDDKGRKRAGIFYKAAFYDRKAHMYLSQRYNWQTEYLGDDAGNRYVMVYDYDGTELYRTKTAPCESLQTECIAWLDQNYPQWRDHSAYWNDDERKEGEPGQ